MQRDFVFYKDKIIQDLQEIFPFSKPPVIIQEHTFVHQVQLEDSSTDIVKVQITTNALTFQLFMQFRMAVIPYILYNYQYTDTPDNFKRLMIEKLDTDLNTKYGVSYDGLIIRFKSKPAVDTK